MTFSPTRTRPGRHAWAAAVAWVDADSWADADADTEVVPWAAQLAAWFAHPSAALEGDWDATGPLPTGEVRARTRDAAGPLPTGEVRARTRDAAGPLPTGEVHARTRDADTGPDAAAADSGGEAAAATVPGWVEVEWLAAPVRPAVRGLMSLAPGPGLLAALAVLPSGPCPDPHTDLTVHGRPAPGSVPGFACACQLVTAAAWDAMATWTGTQAAVHLVDIAGPDLVTVLPDGAPVAARTVDPVRSELAPMLHLSPDSTGTRLAQGRTLTQCPVLVQALTSGVMTAAGARALLGETTHLCVQATVQVVTAVVAKVHARREAGIASWTATELGRVAKRAVAALADDEKAKARQDAYADRRVSVTSAGHGMAWLSFLVRDVDAHRIYNRLTAHGAAAKAHAREHHTGDDRTADQHRADIAVATLLGHPHGHHTTEDTGTDTGVPDDVTDAAAAPGATGPVPRPGRPEINVLVTLATLLGLSQDPGQVPGLGPIDPDIARELAADGRWRLWITDPTTGQVTATGSRTYTPSAALARLIRAREPVCRMPGCNRRSVNCDLDHTIPWPHEPGTTQSNLGPLCRAHHNLKTHHGFTLVNNPPPDTDTGPDPADTGPTTWTWTMPSGMHHTRTTNPPLRE